MLHTIMMRIDISLVILSTMCIFSTLVETRKRERRVHIYFIFFLFPFVFLMLHTLVNSGHDKRVNISLFRGSVL